MFTTRSITGILKTDGGDFHFMPTLILRGVIQDFSSVVFLISNINVFQRLCVCQKRQNKLSILTVTSKAESKWQKETKSFCLPGLCTQPLQGEWWSCGGYVTAWAGVEAFPGGGVLPYRGGDPGSPQVKRARRRWRVCPTHNGRV